VINNIAISHHSGAILKALSAEVQIYFLCNGLAVPAGMTFGSCWCKMAM